MTGKEEEQKPQGGKPVKREMLKPSEPLTPKKPGELEIDQKTGMPVREPKPGAPGTPRTPPKQVEYGYTPKKPAAPEQAKPRTPGAPAVPTQKVEPPKTPPAPVQKTKPFDMNDFYTIVGRDRGEFDSLPPVAAIRTKQKYGRSLMSPEPTPEALQNAWDALEALEGKKATQFVEEARKFLASQNKVGALAKLETALVIEPASLENLKTAGDLARTTGNLKKARLYYTLVSRFTRADPASIDPKDVAMVEAAKQALEGMK